LSLPRASPACRFCGADIADAHGHVVARAMGPFRYRARREARRVAATAEISRLESE
jgi:hypothetical protein